jgi:uncharacterized membrane protein
MRYIHITAGVLALIAGFIALYATKGASVHRKFGMAFAIAMLTMTSSAAIMAAFLRPHRGNVVAALLTLYLVSTSLLTVRRTVAQSRAMVTGFMLVGLVVGAQAFGLGLEAMDSPNGIDGIPAPPLFMFGFVGVLASALDARVLAAGVIEGKHRLARHLWRMTFAMWIATTSAFLGQAKFFPDPIRKVAFLAIPVLLVTIALFYWLIRVLFVRRRPLPVRSASTNPHAFGSVSATALVNSTSPITPA